MLWVVVSSFIAALVLAFGLGANDVSNAFATSIGAKVITLKTACLIASIAEVSGSLGLGGLVTESVITTTIVPNIMSADQTMLVMFTTLLSVSLWLLIATWLKLPVSATHAVISSIIGATLVQGPYIFRAVNWRDLNKFIVAWVVAPLLSGIISVAVYFCLAKLVLFYSNSFHRGIIAIPYIYALTIVVNVVLIEYQVIMKTADPSTMSLGAGLAAAVAVIVTVATFLFSKHHIVPWVKRNIYMKLSGLDGEAGGDLVAQEEFLSNADAARMELQTEQLFSFLQILSAVFTSFVHGSNDVSNSVGPLYGLYNAYQQTIRGEQINSSSGITYGLLAYGSFGMVLGLYIWGSRVIETIGENLTVISPSRGFSIEFGSALTVLIASMLKLSVSTTHCKVGSIVSVGFFSSWMLARHRVNNSIETAEEGQNDSCVEDAALPDKEREEAAPLKPGTGASINPKLILNIVASWLCTIPFSGLLAAGLYAALAAMCLPRT